MNGPAKWIVGTMATVGILLLAGLAARSWYMGAFDVIPRSESYCNAVDAALKPLSQQHGVVGDAVMKTTSGTPDAYAWYPPRPVPVYQPDTTFVGYDVYALVEAWEPEEKLLQVRSYGGSRLMVRLDPEMDGSIAVVAPMDKYGAIPDAGAIHIVSTSNDALWRQLFCPWDVVAVQVRSRANLEPATRVSPIVPLQVRLERRLCGV